jgi:hypothetical protein
MKHQKYLQSFLIVIFLLPGAAFSTPLPVFSGRWQDASQLAGSEKPYSTFDLILNEDDRGHIQGSYCFVTRFGNRIDCGSTREMNLSGNVTDSAKKAIVNFYSFFGAKNGVAELSTNDDGLIVWNVLKQPQGGNYYGPNHAILRRVVSNAGMSSGERQVVADKAYLYDQPSTSAHHKAYVVKGDYVKLITVSSDLKFWKVSFTSKSGKIIEDWINCKDIEFFPN